MSFGVVIIYCVLDSNTSIWLSDSSCMLGSIYEYIFSVVLINGVRVSAANDITSNTKVRATIDNSTQFTLTREKIVHQWPYRLLLLNLIQV